MKIGKLNLILFAVSVLGCLSVSSCTNKSTDSSGMQNVFSMDWESAIKNRHASGELLVTLSEAASRSIISKEITDQQFFGKAGLALTSIECLTTSQLKDPGVLSGSKEVNLIYLLTFENKSDDAHLLSAKTVANISGVIEVGFNYTSSPSNVSIDPEFSQQ